MAGVSATGRQARFDPASGKTETKAWRLSSEFDGIADAVLHVGDTLEFLRTLPGDSVQLVISSPPYNLGKEYEIPRRLEAYLSAQGPVLSELVRVLKPGGSLCWEVGNYVEKGEVFPLDMYYYPALKALGLQLRNRVVWHFGHGLHASRRLSGRYEILLWFTKGETYRFNLDAIRLPAKYPGKRHYKGPKIGQLSGNPLGVNPSDFWQLMSDEWAEGIWDIPNVKANHPEKTIHPCQFPVELVERCVLAFTKERDIVLDPYSGVGSTAIAALKNGRRAVCVDKGERYVQIARQRVADLQLDRLVTRPIGTKVHQPTGREKVAKLPKEWT
ncbi:MAG: DNA-methyltransferase [Thermoplasmata archaeon]